MGQIDDYLRSQVTPQLIAGEQIMGFGCVRRPIKFNVIGVPERYEEWLATATNFRLILFKTENSGLFNVLTVKPKPMNTDTRIWWYQELRQVNLGTVQGIGNGLYMALAPHAPLGPYNGEGKRYDMFPAAEGLDAHAQFYQQYRTWLQGQVAAGAFPMDEQRRGIIAAHEEKLRQEAERKRLAAEERKRKAAAFFASWRTWLPPTIAAILVFSAIGFWIAAADYFGSSSRHAQDVEKMEQDIEKAKACRKTAQRNSSCPDEKWEKEQRGKIDDESSEKVEDWVYTGVLGFVGLLFLAGAGGVGAFWFVRRKKLAAANAQPPAQAA